MSRLIAFVVSLGLALTMTRGAYALSTDDIIAMVKSGAKDDKILARIQELKPNEDIPHIGAMEALRLKNAGASDAVVAALIKAGEQAEAAGQPPVKDPATTVPDAKPLVTIDDIIEAHQGGATAEDLRDRVWGLKLDMRGVDRAKLREAGVPYGVIQAASSDATKLRPVSTRPAPTRQRPARAPSATGFGERTTVMLEVGGGFASTSVEATSASVLRLSPSVHVWLNGIVDLGVESDLVFSDGPNLFSLFALAGVTIPFGTERGFLLRFAGRLGFETFEASDAVAAYGLQIAAMARVGKLLAGVGLNTTWASAPALDDEGWESTTVTTNTTVLEIRIGTWF